VDRRTRALVAAWLSTYRSANTRDAYGRDVAAFVQWCTAEELEPLQVTAEDLGRYRDGCLARGATPATVTRRLSGIASFLRFAATGTGTDAQTNPADAVARPGPGDPISQVALDDEEMAALLEAAEELGPKTSALVSLLALEGLRLNEVLAIDVPRLRTTGEGTFVALRGRHGGAEVELTQRSALAVAAYLADRRRGPLFLGESAVTDRRARLSRFGADFLVKRAGASAGLDKAVSANVLRRSYVRAAQRAGTPLAAISKQVGHRELRETARMLAPAP
jgi:site-specific recombinase XerD